jgi:ubiquinone/menaquinone biosynthesis C-methylase UbiE
MEKFNILGRIKELYDRGENIIQHLRSFDSRKNNTLEDILISYDFQAGSYIGFTEKNSEFNSNYTQALANVIASLGEIQTVLEVGVGEATILCNLKNKLPGKIKVGGFDLSWSRIYYAVKYAAKNDIDAFLCTGDLFSSPFADSSIDVVYTSHSIEPNGGREREALEELYRITNKYLILLEPSFEFSGEEARKRMVTNGYITNLSQTIRELGYELMEHRLFDYTINPLNPTAIHIIKKQPKFLKTSIEPACPILKTPLMEKEDHFFSPQSLLSYPKIKSIPCLAPFNAVLTSKMEYE